MNERADFFRFCAQRFAHQRLGGKVFQPVRTRKQKALARIGFLVPKAKKEPDHVVTTIRGFLRHPLTLVLAGFILTGFLGTILQTRYQERQKQNDATIKSMDDMRVQIDNVFNSLADYTFRADRLVWAMDTATTRAPIDSAAEQYVQALGEWRKQSRVGFRILKQLYYRSFSNCIAGTNY